MTPRRPGSRGLFDDEGGERIRGTGSGPGSEPGPRGPARGPGRGGGGEDGDTPARELLAAVDQLLGHASPGTAGRWSRAAALLTRQALETALRFYWTKLAPGVEECDFRAQFLCLGRYLGDEALAQRAHVVWSGLSGACHHHVYDLAPTREELQAWREVVMEVVERTERAWRA